MVRKFRASYFWVLLSAYLVSIFIPYPHQNVCANPATDHNLAIVLTGLSGGLPFRKHFNEAADNIVDVLSAHRYSENGIYRFQENPPNQTDQTKHALPAQRGALKKLLMDASNVKEPYESLFVFIAGHADGRDENAKLHLLGRDVRYRTLIRWIDRIPAKNMLVVVIAPQGHIWIEKLSRKGRVIIAGNGLREFDFIPVQFLRAFPYLFKKSWGQATSGDVQAAGPTGKKSLFDIFVDTQKVIQEWYYENHIHPTEKALIDANGDGKGTEAVTMKLVAASGGNSRDQKIRPSGQDSSFDRNNHRVDVNQTGELILWSIQEDLPDAYKAAAYPFPPEKGENNDNQN